MAISSWGAWWSGRNGARDRRAVGGVRLREVIVGAHLDQAAHGAREFLRVVAGDVQRLGGGVGGRDELHLVVVQDVDEPREAARQVPLLGGHHRNAGQEY